jgi:hypothetical protein
MAIHTPRVQQHLAGLGEHGGRAPGRILDVGERGDRPQSRRLRILRGRWLGSETDRRPEPNRSQA